MERKVMVQLFYQEAHEAEVMRDRFGKFKGDSFFRFEFFFEQHNLSFDQEDMDGLFIFYC